MKNATVIMPYDDFQEVKEKADKLEAKIKKLEKGLLDRENLFLELCRYVEKGAYCEDANVKQYYLARGVKAICDYYKFDLVKEFGEVEEGTPPPEKEGRA